MHKTVTGLAISLDGVAESPRGLAVLPPEPVGRKGVPCLSFGR
jgi:hypothetical protein